MCRQAQLTGISQGLWGEGQKPSETRDVLNGICGTAKRAPI